ncbi:MAG TPA: hypothetical protein VLL49_00475 [Anaerolineales bacterium]|nr:hypothetical protein [Anaerolineales bacterium]
MADFTRELFLQALDEWGRFPAAFRGQTAEQQTEFLSRQGYASLRDLLAHVAVWWEEARGVIEDTIKHGERRGRKYDIDAFNGQAIKRFQSTPESGFMTWYETQREQLVTLVSALSAEQLKLGRIQRWLDGVVLEHLKEHGMDAPRFLVVDMLQREWAGYARRFHGLTAAKRSAFLRKQGFGRFQDLLAHILAWWEKGIAVIESSAGEDPGEVDDVDAFNALAVAASEQRPAADVEAHFEQARLTIAELTDMLPEDVLRQPNIQSWLRADVIDHYYEHAP